MTLKARIAKLAILTAWVGGASAARKARSLDGVRPVLEYEYDIVINRPLEEVFDYMQDISREREWQPNLREAEQQPEGEPGVGTRRRYVSEFMGRRFENVYINTVYEPYHKVAYKTAPESDTQATGEVLWERAEGGTRVTMRVEAELGGALRFVPKGIVTAVGKKELSDSLSRVKALLEERSSEAL